MELKPLQNPYGWCLMQIRDNFGACLVHYKESSISLHGDCGGPQGEGSPAVLTNDEPAASHYFCIRTCTSARAFALMNLEAEIPKGT